MNCLRSLESWDRGVRIPLKAWMSVCILVSCSANFRPWRWRWHVPPKRRLTYGLHDKFHNYRCENLIFLQIIHLFMFVFMLTTEHSRVFTLPIRGNAVRNLGSSPFRRFAFEYAHLWQGCRHVCQLSVIGLAPRVSWQIYLAWTSKVKLTQQSSTQLMRRVFRIISLLSQHIFCIFRTAFRSPYKYGGKITEVLNMCDIAQNCLWIRALLSCCTLWRIFLR
jgi:hypothetical protein